MPCWKMGQEFKAAGQAGEAVTLDGFDPDLVADLAGVVVPFQGLPGFPAIRAPGFLQRAALASVCRLANRLDVAKNELLTSTLRRRLATEIQGKWEELRAFRAEGRSCSPALKR